MRKIFSGLMLGVSIAAAALSSVTYAEVTTNQAVAKKYQAAISKSKGEKSNTSDDVLIKQILAKINKKFPSTQITSIQKAPKIDGLYEVVMGRNVAYVDSKAEVFLFGHIFDMATQQDITQAHIDEMNKVDFNQLPLDKAIKIVKGDGSRIFAAFTDPDCPYCKQLEQNLVNVDNYTMYVFLFPIAQLHPEAQEHANSIWCAKDKVKAWHEFMLEGKLPVEDAINKGCITPIDELAQFGQSLGVNGTPTLVRKDGKLAPGAPQGPMLEVFLSGGNLQPQRIGVNQNK